jgi:hypothetical protein
VAPPVLPCTPKPPTQPAGKSNCLGNPLGQAGERLGPSGALFARARCSFWPYFCSYFACRVARGSPRFRRPSWKNCLRRQREFQLRTWISSSKPRTQEKSCSQQPRSSRQ